MKRREANEVFDFFFNIFSCFMLILCVSDLIWMWGQIRNQFLIETGVIARFAIKGFFDSLVISGVIAYLLLYFTVEEEEEEEEEEEDSDW